MFAKAEQTPPLVLGFMRLLDYPELASPARLADWISRRLDQGLDTFDHADIYGGGVCEKAFGDALRVSPMLKKKIRVITKAGIVPANQDHSTYGIKHYRATGRYLTDAIDQALKRLNIERIDTFLIHRPDPLMDAAEVARTMERAVAAGKIVHIGVSNFLPEQWRWLAANTRLPLACNQSQLSLSHSDALFDGTLEAHLRDHLPWLAWSPLAGGSLLTSNFDSMLETACADTGLTSTGLATAWLRQLPGTPIPVLGSMKEDRIQQAVDGCRTPLPRSLWFALLEAARGSAVA